MSLRNSQQNIISDHYSQLNYQPTSGIYQMLKLTTDPSEKQMDLSIKTCLQNGDMPRVQVKATTGFVGFKSRKHISEKLGISIEPKIKKSQYIAKKDIYTPQTTKFDGYVHHPRPRVLPYTNKIVPQLQVSMQQMKPKQSSSVNTMKDGTREQVRKGYQSNSKVYGEVLSASIAEHNRLRQIQDPDYKAPKAKQTPRYAKLKVARQQYDVSERQVVLNQVSQYCDDLMGGNASVSIQKMQSQRKENPYQIAKTQQISKSNSRSHIELKGVTGRFQQGRNPNKMSSFKYVDNTSNHNEKNLAMRANLIENRDGFINGRAQAMPTKRAIGIIDRKNNSVDETYTITADKTSFSVMDTRPFKSSMRDSISSLKFQQMNENKSSFSTKSKNYDFTSDDGFRKTNMYGYQNQKQKYQSNSIIVGPKRLDPNEYSDRMDSLNLGSRFQTGTSIQNGSIFQDSSSILKSARSIIAGPKDEKIVKNYLQQKISLKSMLKQSRLSKLNKQLENEPPVEEKKQKVQKKSKNVKRAIGSRQSGRDSASQRSEISQEIADILQNQTENEDDSIIGSDDYNDDFTSGEQFLRVSNSHLEPQSILSAMKTGHQHDSALDLEQHIEKNIPTDLKYFGPPKQYRAHTKGKFQNNVAQPNQVNFSNDINWKHKANPVAHKYETEYMKKDKYHLERRRFQKVLQQVALEEQVGISVTKIPEIYKHKIQNKANKTKK